MTVAVTKVNRPGFPYSPFLSCAAVAAALLFSAGCIPSILRGPGYAPIPLPKQTSLPKTAPALTMVKDLDIPGEVLAVNERYIVNIDDTTMQIRDRAGKITYQPKRAFDLGGASNSRVHLAGPLLYVLVEHEKKPGKFVSEAWVIDIARKRIDRLPRLARVLKLAGQDLAFGTRSVAISQGQSLTIFDLATQSVVSRQQKQRPFTPVGWQSDRRLIGISDIKPDRRTSGADIVRYDPSDKSLRWVTNFPKRVQLDGGLLGQGYLVTGLIARPEDLGPEDVDRKVLALLRLSDGRLTFKTSGLDDTPLFIDKTGVLYFARSGHLGLWKARVFGGGPSGRSLKERAVVQGRVRQKWVAQMPGDVNGDVCFAPDGTIYVPTWAHLVAVARDGRVKWRVKVGAYTPASVVATDGVVYLGAKDVRAYRSDGRMLWKRGGGGNEIHGLALGSDGTIYLGDARGHVYALDDHGTEKWRRTVAVGRQSHASQPAVASDGTIYVTSSRGNLHAFWSDGRAKWTFDGGSRMAYNPVAAPNGDIYFSVEEGTGARLCAVRPDGTARWSRTCDDIVADLTVAPDGTIYFTEFKGLRALDALGRVKWTFPGRGGLSDPVPGRGGTVYVASSSGKLVTLTARGKKLWQYRTGSESSAVVGVGPDGIVYAVTADALLALEVRHTQKVPGT